MHHQVRNRHSCISKHLELRAQIGHPEAIRSMIGPAEIPNDSNAEILLEKSAEQVDEPIDPPQQMVLRDVALDREIVE